MWARSFSAIDDVDYRISYCWDCPHKCQPIRVYCESTDTLGPTLYYELSPRSRWSEVIDVNDAA
jgi:hypothetical protein